MSVQAVITELSWNLPLISHANQRLNSFYLNKAWVGGGKGRGDYLGLAPLSTE